MSTTSVETVIGQGNLPMLKIRAPQSEAEIYLHGAHLTHFQKTGEQPLLFMSKRSWFEADKAIRGGVPICFPWFGPRPGQPSHGLVRTLTWELAETSIEPDGRTKVRLVLPTIAKQLGSNSCGYDSLRAEFLVIVGDELAMELIVKNESPDKVLEVENCLHTYFHVSDINAVSITGLCGAPYLDNTSGNNGERKNDHNTVLTIHEEINRLYLNNTSTVGIRDENFGRLIRVDKTNSQSTVIWNPWTTQKMPADFDPTEHKNMVCVESGNIRDDKITLTPSASTSLKVILSSCPLK